MRTMCCPKCHADISDTHMDDDPDTGIIGGWVCEACNIGVGEIDDDPELDFD